MAGAEVADVLLVPVGTALYAVRAENVRVDVVPSLDLTRPIATVTFSDAPGDAIGAFDVPERAELRRRLLASEQLGVAEWCLSTTLSYIKERHQFARPVGSFQAIKHRMADLWLDVVRARAAARNAADLLAADRNRPRPATRRRSEPRAGGGGGQVWCAEVAVHVAEESVQLHGGIGMTWEHPLHLYLKRAKSTEIALGTPGAHRDALAPRGPARPLTNVDTMTSGFLRGHRSRSSGRSRGRCRPDPGRSEVSSRSAKCAPSSAPESAPVRAVPGAQVVDGAEEEVDDDARRGCRSLKVPSRWPSVTRSRKRSW